MPTITVLEIRDAVYAWLPNIMHISKIPNNKLIKKIEAYISQITKLHSNATITRLHSMFSMVNSAANGCMYYQDFLSYYDEQAKNLYENICQGNQTWQKKVKAKLEQSVLDISDKNVIVVEDVLDTGHTLKNLVNYLERKNPRLKNPESFPGC